MMEGVSEQWGHEMTNEEIACIFSSPQTLIQCNQDLRNPQLKERFLHTNKSEKSGNIRRALL